MSDLDVTHPWHQHHTSTSPLLAAATGHRPSPDIPGATHRPVWFMRQAGRSLPEYREVRQGTDMLDACLNPELTAEITCQPVRRHHVDAGIFFSDIVVPMKLAGIDVEIVPGTGPVVAHPIRTEADIAALEATSADDFEAALDPIREAVRLTTAELTTTPLIGFCGAPFTVASYLVEGGPSREYLHTKALMFSRPALWHRLAAWVADRSGRFLRAQVLAGASAVQLFDSWAGGLSLEDYTTYVQQHSAEVFDHVTDLPVPRIHFGVNTAELLVAMRAAGATVMGVDHRLPLDEANARLGGTTPLQGNIDPAMLFATPQARETAVRRVLDRGTAAPGHIVNLGHGVPQHTDPGVLTDLVAMVHDLTRVGAR
ncbi:uroporphyrinogen decarboxylase [Propionibacteriaceae bacterium G1746]|uniref:uroporphyrinogen decarboxylase n=1 Tax=Aestuariimicrobium sp. G57 TaxID=3418485 RepID=UPI003C28DD17